MTAQHSDRVPAAPVKHAAHWDAEQQTWLVSRYADAMAVLRSPDFSTAACLDLALAGLSSAAQTEIATLTHVIGGTLAYLDGPGHTRMRRLVNDIFQPQLAERLRSRIRQLMADMLEPLRSNGSLDLARDVAYPLAALLFTELFGLPQQDWQLLARWADDFTALAGPAFGDPAARRQAEQAIQALERYFALAIAARRAAETHDLLAVLIAAEHNGDRLNDDELIAACVMTLIGGHRSLRHTVSASLLALLGDPALQARIQSDRSLLPALVEEVLRTEGGVTGFLNRVATTETNVAGATICPGQRVTLVLQAANHDPARYPEPGRFDIDRLPNAHLTFGGGIHLCPGAPLARVTTEVMLSAMLDLLPDLQLSRTDADPGLPAPALRSLPVIFSSR